MGVYGYIYIHMDVCVYALRMFAEISILDPRLSIGRLLELTKYDYSKGVLNVIHSAVKEDKKTIVASPV